MTILSYLKFSISMKIIDKSKTSSVDSGQANTTYKKTDRYSIYYYWSMNTYIITYSMVIYHSSSAIKMQCRINLYEVNCIHYYYHKQYKTDTTILIPSLLVEPPTLSIFYSFFIHKNNHHNITWQLPSYEKKGTCLVPLMLSIKCITPPPHCIVIYYILYLIILNWYLKVNNF